MILVCAIRHRAWRGGQCHWQKKHHAQVVMLAIDCGDLSCSLTVGRIREVLVPGGSVALLRVHPKNRLWRSWLEILSLHKPNARTFGSIGWRLARE
jgi:hypothetical protein